MVEADGLVSTSLGSGFGQNGSTLYCGAFLLLFATACCNGLQTPTPTINAGTTVPRKMNRPFFVMALLLGGTAAARKSGCRPRKSRPVAKRHSPAVISVRAFAPFAPSRIAQSS